MDKKTDIEALYITGRKLLYKELSPIWEALSSVNYAVVKGEALSQQIYGDSERRHSCDVDILIEKDDVRELERLLRKIGFEQREQGKSVQARQNRIMCLAYSHQIPAYYKRKYWMQWNIDVNYDIFWGEYEGQRYPVKEFLSDVIETDIYGFKVKVLTIEKAFVQLILHHYKEMNSLYHLSNGNSIRTKLFKDIYDMMILKREFLYYKCIERLCEQYQIGVYVYYMLFFANKLFHHDLLDEILAKLVKYRNEELLNSYGLCFRERKEWKVSFENRLDNDKLWDIIFADMSKEDRKKIELNHSVFM